jgi:effector-binding domain-containing protein
MANDMPRKEVELMDDSVKFLRVGAIPLAVVRRTTPRNQLSRVIPEACGLVWNALKAAGVRGGRHVSVYLGESEGLVHVEIGAEIPTPFPGRGEAVASATPAGEVATATHFGPYGLLGRAHGAIKSACSSQDRALDGRSWEIYGHWLDEWNSDPSKIRTDVFYLLKS